MVNNSNNSGYTTLRSNIPNGGEQMREITIYQLKGEKFLVSENGRGVQTLSSHVLKHYLEEAGHKGKDYKKTRTILSRVGNTTVMTFKG